MNLHELVPVVGWPASRRDRRRFERFSEVRENLISRGRSHPGLPPLANLRFGVSRLLPAVYSEPDVSGRDPDTIPSLKVCPPCTETGSDRRVAENAWLGPHRCRRPRGVLERPDAHLRGGLCGGGKGGRGAGTYFQPWNCVWVGGGPQRVNAVDRKAGMARHDRLHSWHQRHRRAVDPLTGHGGETTVTRRSSSEAGAHPRRRS